MSSTVHAPELSAALGWLNTDRPLRLTDELRGQVVVLDFWTYCCINCMHILPDLARLEQRFHNDPVTFIGVHSAKFTNEASRETIRAAMLRYEIKHPVVIDDRMKIWRAYAVRSWPTLVVINPRGYVVGSAAGESAPQQIEPMIDQALASARADGSLAPAPLKIRLEEIAPTTTGLAFPGKVLADAAARRLFVADSNHNRIVIAELPDERGQAKVLRVVGSGAIGAADGPADSATFNHPQGLAAALGNLYVADTENHLIRAIDLETYEVMTVVGTGKMTYDFSGGGMGIDQGINSPWDLCVEGSTLYVAMAGCHQIWRIDLPVGFARALAGNGRENLVDGPTETSAFAQPSGICAMGGKLYVADSEVSAIRGVDMATEQVFTVIGEGLFSFGDIDGVAPKAKLQHPLGVAAWNGSLLVADTYNHKIKVVEPGARSARTLYGSGRPRVIPSRDREGATEPVSGAAPKGELTLFEPGGLSVAGDRLFIADTNNHRVVVCNLRTHHWTDVRFSGLDRRGEPPTSVGADVRAGRHGPPESDRTGSPRQNQSALVRSDEQNALLVAGPFAIAPDHETQLSINILLPPGSHLSPEAPWLVRVTSNGTTLAERTGRSASMPLIVPIPPTPALGLGEWQIEAAFASCTESKGGACTPHELRWRASVRPGDAREIALSGRPR